MFPPPPPPSTKCHESGQNRAASGTCLAGARLEHVLPRGRKKPGPRSARDAPGGRMVAGVR